MSALAERLRATLDAERDRWFLWWPVLFGAGIALYFAFPGEPWLGALLALALTATVFHIWAREQGLWLLPAAAVAAVTCGAVMAKLRTEFVRAPVLAEADVRTVVTGWLQLVEPRASGGQRLTIRTVSLTGVDPGGRPEIVRITTRQSNPELQPGDHIVVRAVLSPPPGPVLPGAYDFGRAAWYQRLGAVGFSTGKPERVAEPGPPPAALKVLAAIEATRLAITRRITTALPGETGAVAAALITGERGGISEETNNAYRMSGLFHILSISGLHMVVMAGALYWLVRLILAAVPAFVLNLPARKIAAVIALIGALAYLLMSGAAVATVRSYVMISIMFLAVLMDRPAVALRNIAVAAALILIVMPESILDPGFQMSFAAVTALVAVHEALRHRRERLDRAGIGKTPLSGPFRMLREIVLSTLVASAAVAPFGIFHFHNTQTMALVANIVAIPVCNLLVMPAALASLIAMPLGLEQAPLWFMGQGIGIMNTVAGHVATFPGAIWRLPDIPRAAFALLVAGGIWLILWSTAWRVAGIALMAAGAALAPFQPRPDLIVGRDGEAVAYRQANGNLGIIAAQSATFDVTRWLEHDGDDRTTATVRSETDARCDRAACIAEVAGRPISIIFHPSALVDECTRATILVTGFPIPIRCRNLRAETSGIEPDAAGGGKRLLTIEPAQLVRRDVVTVHFRNEIAIVESASQSRARRPWGNQ